jgi:AcrR family transcriptional regulator
MMKRGSTGEDTAPSVFSLRMRLCPRKGRPSASMAGEVEQRILDAATEVFLEHGFAGASLERIAERASASKATLYSRYANKEALFSAVVKRSVSRSMQLIEATPPSDVLLEKLVGAGRALVTRLLSDELIGLIRVVVADAPRFPALAQMTHEGGRLRAIEAITAIIASHSKYPRDTRTAATMTRSARALATQVLDCLVSPLMMRALMGENPEELREEIRSHVNQTLAVFEAAKKFEPFF